MDLLEQIAPLLANKRYLFPKIILSPTAAQAARLRFRNSLHLYNRRCDLTGEEIVSSVPPETRKVYSNKAWLGDRWNALDYGRDFDFSRPFFEQFHELLQAVPMQAVSVKNCENSDYSNYLSNSRNCYLVLNSTESADTFYSSESIYLYNSAFTHWSNKIESSAYVNRCLQLNSCFYCLDCGNSSNLLFCRDCTNCNDCLGCTNLMNKSYCIYNVQYSKEEYAEFLKYFKRDSHEQWNRMLRQSLDFWRTQPIDLLKSFANENVSGNFVYRSKECHDCFFVTDSDHCFNMFSSSKNNYCRDADYTYDCSFGAYQTVACASLNIGAFLVDCDICSNTYYSSGSYSLQSCFGCAGLTNQSYCIFNKVYTPAEYEKLLPKIIEHMQKTGEWGQFFPADLSPFRAGECDLALFEQNKAAPSAKKTSTTKLLTTDRLPDSSLTGAELIVDQPILCPESGRYYSITAADLALCQKLKIPLPRMSFHAHLKDILLSNKPYAPEQFKCTKCAKEFKISKTKVDEGIVYCHDCYLAEYFT